MSPKGLFYLIIASLTFGFTFITDKIGIDSGVDPGVFSFVRIFFALIFVFLVWLKFRKSRKLKLTKKYIPNLIVIGVIASGVAILIANISLQTTTATNVGVMQGLIAATTMIFAYFMLKERLPGLFYPVLILMVIGLILLTSDGFTELPKKGDFLVLTIVPIVAFVNSYAKKTMKNLHWLSVALGRFLFGSIFLVLAIPFFGIDKISTISNGFIWVILSAILVGFRVIAFYKGIELEGPTLAATMLSIGPVITIIMESLVLGASFSLVMVLGFLMVIIGAIFVTQMKAKYPT